MSQHVYRNVSLSGSWVEVAIGWNRVEQALYCTVRPLKDTELGEPIYDLAHDARADRGSLAYVTALLVNEFSLVLPQQLLMNLMLDVARGIDQPLRVY